MTKTFKFTFVDDPSRLSYDVSGDERLTVEVEEGRPSLFVNRAACAVLARVFGQMALSDYPDGFHVHLPKNLNPDSHTSDVLTILVHEPRKK